MCTKVTIAASYPYPFPMRNRQELTVIDLEPCPGWCAYSDSHVADDDAAERGHQGSFATVTLTLEAPDITWTADHKVAGVEPAVVGLVMVQDQREAEPRILMSHNEQTGLYLTPAEAAQLSEILADFARHGGAYVESTR